MLGLRGGLCRLSLTATGQVWTVSLKAGLYTYKGLAPDRLQPSLVPRSGFRRQVKRGVRQRNLLRRKPGTSTMHKGIVMETSPAAPADFCFVHFTDTHIMAGGVHPATQVDTAACLRQVIGVLSALEPRPEARATQERTVG